jgi:hypothetical protein
LIANELQTKNEAAIDPVRNGIVRASKDMFAFLTCTAPAANLDALIVLKWSKGRRAMPWVATNLIVCICLSLFVSRDTTCHAEERNAPTASAEVPRLRLEIDQNEWGTASREDIQAVCESAGRELTSYFPGRKLEPIKVGQANGGSPITLFKRGDSGEIRMLLNTRDTFWAQFAFQFGHELCHVLCNYREANNPQLWFEESLCETASLFVMRRMADSWKIDPPYYNWKSFAPAFDNYVDERISSTAKIEESSLADWYRNHRSQLESNATNRELNQVVAVKVLLPLLQMNPQHWQALNHLNQWDAKQRLTFAEYLQDWHDRVPVEHKAFVATIADRFEITLNLNQPTK